MKRAYLLGCILFILDVGINVILILHESAILGVFSLIAGILVFSCGMIWLIHRDDEALHLRSPYLIFPLGILGFAFVEMLEKCNLVLQPGEENLQEIGNITMAQYQAGLWLVAAISLMVFVVAGSLMARRR
jgi:hypothetical protein